MANQYHEKKNSASLAIREMEIKNTMRCHLAPTKMAITKETDITNVDEGVEKLEFS